VGSELLFSTRKPEALTPLSWPVEYTHINLNDQTLEGFRHRREPILAVQYHPEAAPGPHDSFYLFGEFMKMIDDAKG
jgi:carbamoyl-phosphate synthase small subunit